jgi:hypothetical protein
VIDNSIYTKIQIEGREMGWFGKKESFGAKEREIKS